MNKPAWWLAKRREENLTKIREEACGASTSTPKIFHSVDWEEIEYEQNLRAMYCNMGLPRLGAPMPRYSTTVLNELNQKLISKL